MSKSKTVHIIHSVNGNVDPVNDFIEVEGQKFEKGEDGKPKVGADGKPVPYVPKDGGRDYKSLTPEELAKENPAIAELLKQATEGRARLSEFEKAEEDRKRKEAEGKGEWQKLADEANGKLSDAQKKLAEKDDMLGKYKGTVEKILEGMKKDIPKERLSLIPADFSPRQQLEYITANIAFLTGNGGGGKKGGGVDPNEVNPDGSEEGKIVARMDELIKKKGARTQAEDREMSELAVKLKELRKSK